MLSTWVWRLREAVKHGDVAEVKVVLDRHPALIHSSKWGEQNLLFHGTMLVNERHDEGKGQCTEGTQALLAALSHRQVDLVQLLIEKGVDLEGRGPKGTTALISAAELGHLDVVKVLIKGGAHLDARDEDGTTALIAAAKHGFTEVVEVLLKAGADMEAADEGGSTALLRGVASGTAMVQCLVDRGANTGARDKLGMTALDFAENDEIRHLLRQVGPRNSEAMAGLTRGSELSPGSGC